MFYFVMLFIILVIQTVLQYFLIGLGLPGITIELIINFVLAFIFAFLNYRGNKRYALKDIRFHGHVFIYFIIFSVITLLFVGISYIL